MSIHYIYSLLCACGVPCHHTFLEVPVSDTYATDLDLKLTLHVLHFSSKRFIVCCYTIATCQYSCFHFDAHSSPCFWCHALYAQFLIAAPLCCSVTLLQCHFTAVTLYCCVTSLQSFHHGVNLLVHSSVTITQTAYS